jgi:hypothetical protein
MIDGRPVVDLAVAGLASGLGDDLLSVVVYGSRSRGTARVDSDWDVLVIARGLPARVLARHVLLKRMLPSSVRGMVAIYALTPEELSTAWPPPALHLDIALDAEVAYDPSRLAATWISRVRAAIDAEGLCRVDTAFGKQWRRSGSVTQVP